MHNIYQFLFLATQKQTNSQEIRTLLEKIIKNNLLQELYVRSYMHGIFPLIFKHFLENKNILDAQFYDKVKLINKKMMQKSMLMTAQLLKINLLFTQNNIQVLAFKGPLLSQLIHNDFTSRQYVDLDLLVDTKSLSLCTELLAQSGYQALLNPLFLKNKLYLKLGKDFAFYNKALDIKLELHWKLVEKKVMQKQTNNFTRLQKVTIQGQTLLTLNNEDLLLYLSMHGSKHGFERIEWIVDIDRLISCSTSLNWKFLFKEAEELKIYTFFLTALHICSTLYNTAIPASALQKIHNHQQSKKISLDIIASIYDDIITKESNIPISIASINNIIRFKDSFTQRVYSRFRAYFSLKEGDILLINLPNYLSLFYYILRPIRIMLKYLK